MLIDIDFTTFILFFNLYLFLFLFLHSLNLRNITKRVLIPDIFMALIMITGHRFRLLAVLAILSHLSYLFLNSLILLTFQFCTDLMMYPFLRGSI